MNEPFPNKIVAQSLTLGRELSDFADQHRDQPLADLERGVLDLVRKALPHLLGQVLKQSLSALDSSGVRISRRCPVCSERTRLKSWRERKVLTLCGKISFSRPWYICKKCKQGFSPVDQSLELKERSRLSPEIRALLVDLGAKTSFTEAKELLEKLTGLQVAKETIREHTERAGACLEEAKAAAAAKVERTREPAEPVDKAPGQIVIQTDGVMVRYLDGWHEVKLGLVAGQVDGKLESPSYLARRGAPWEFGPRLFAEAARRGALEIASLEGPITGQRQMVLPKVAILGDGAPWIWNLASEYFGDRTEIVDYYHASEHIWSLAEAFYGQRADRAKTWANRQCGRLLTKGPQGLLRALGAIKRRSAEANDVLRREKGYFLTNQARMAYPTFKEQGLPIGSGAVESAARHLVQQRMKRAGARWSKLGAQNVLNIRSQILSRLPIAC